jgi:hypothetical protein
MGLRCVPYSLPAARSADPIAAITQRDWRPPRRGRMMQGKETRHA